MTIQFYLNNEEKTEITTMYNIQGNSFAVGDIVHLDVEELHPNDTNERVKEFQKTLIKENKELETKFRRQKVKLVRESKCMLFSAFYETKLTIKYYCEIVG